MLVILWGGASVAGFETSTEASRVRSLVGFAVAAKARLYPRLTARENLNFFAGLEGVPRSERPSRIDATLRQIGLEEATDTLVMKFSTGMFQRLRIARALVKRPSVLLLDEPSRSLDPQASTDLCVSFVNLRVCDAVLLTSHNLDEVLGVASSIGSEDVGRLLAEHALSQVVPHADLRRFYFDAVGDPTAELQGSAANLATVFDCAALIFKADFLTTIRYRNAMVGTVMGVLFQVATYLSRAIGPGSRPDGVPTFAFLLIGIGISGYLRTAPLTVLCARSAKRRLAGHLRFRCPPSTPGTLVLLMGISSSLAQLLELGLYMIFGLALSGFRLDQANISGAVAIFALSLLVTVAIGLLCASVQTQKK